MPDKTSAGTSLLQITTNVQVGLVSMKVSASMASMATLAAVWRPGLAQDVKHVSATPRLLGLKIRVVTKSGCESLIMFSLLLFK